MPRRTARSTANYSSKTEAVTEETRKRPADAQDLRQQSKRTKVKTAEATEQSEPASVQPDVNQETGEKADGNEGGETETQAEAKTEKKKRGPAKKKEKNDDSEAALAEMALAARTPGLRTFIGAHVSAAKGVENAVFNSVQIGGNAFALFLKSQRKWVNPPLSDDHAKLFHKACDDHKYDGNNHILPHGSYLVNLAQDEPPKAQQAYGSFLDDLKRCEALGIKLYNFHPGAAGQTTMESAITRLAKALTNALNATSTVIPVLETMCGHGTTIGGPLSHFRAILAQIPAHHHARVGICLDTCHSFAAGYDLRSRASWDEFLAEFDRVIGLRYLRALHLNDSKTPLGSHRDLHANIGTGFLGLRAFHNVMNDPRLERMPMILETPIDRPAGSSSNGNANGKAKAQPKGKRNSEIVEDKGVWAREIKLLESLIGMDPESEEFLRLERELAAEGKEERDKHQAQFDKKNSKAEKGSGGKQKDLKAMFSGQSEGKGNGKTTEKGKGKGRGRKKVAADSTDGESSDESSGE